MLPHGPAADLQVLRLCLDINVFIADFLSRRQGGSGGASSQIIDLTRDGACALGAVQLVVSWRMLTTLHIVLQRAFTVPADQAWAICEGIAAVAEAGPLHIAPALVLGGTGLLPMQDQEDGGVAETAFAGRVDLLVTHDLADFEAGARSRLQTERLLSKPGGGPSALLVRDPLRGGLLAAIPDLATGWLRGQTAPPRKIMNLRVP